ncbi:MAG: hypothetical protein K2Q13_10220 [Nitrosomonas sp.]|uniref:hypothetical protein n=1 Tax=Nitrosomonas sp. TaxID=42353 RepID=UPI0025ED4F08|nr:hypothetical protein [Nitrosomonas sp.]MBY0475417.1 hypothetical protein [Nitrosomonas sp.]
MDDSTMNILYEIDWDLISEIATYYFLFGLIFLAGVLHYGFKDPDEKADIASNLGVVVMTIIAFWPYNLICMVLSWPVWLMPVGDLFRRHK